MSASRKYYVSIATILGEQRKHFKDAKDWAWMVEDFIKLLSVNERFQPETFRRYAMEIANAEK